MNKGILKKIGLPLAVVLVGVVLAMPVLASETPSGNRISNILDASVGVLAMEDWLDMTWNETGGEATFHYDPLDLTLTVGESDTIWVRTENTRGEPIANVLFIVAGIPEGDFTLIAHPDTTDPIPLGWCDVWSVYYYGPRSGFDMPYPYDAITPIEFTANVAAKYEIQVYAIQVPED